VASLRRARPGSQCGYPHAVGFAFGTFREIDPSILNRNVQVNTMGLYICPGVEKQCDFFAALIDSNTGAIVVTGNHVRLAREPSFAALRLRSRATILAEAIALELVRRGACRLPSCRCGYRPRWTRERFRQARRIFVKPQHPEEILGGGQCRAPDRSRVGRHVELRPFGETW